MEHEEASELLTGVGFLKGRSLTLVGVVMVCVIVSD